MTSLDSLLGKLRAILESIPFLDYQLYKPPIIDSEVPRSKADVIPGLRIFKDAVKREVEVLEQFLARHDHGSDISTNAPYFIAVWNEILSAPPPIVAIGKIFDLPGGKAKYSAARGTKPGGVKVDVVADEGRTWIRVSTIQNSRLLAEFREFDSYLTSSDSEDEDVDDENLFDPPTDQDNSLLRTGRALLAASTVPVPGTNEKPNLMLRLTRLDPMPTGGTDPRISQTIDTLQCMGIDIQFGERSFRTLYEDEPAASPSPALPAPTNRINLDLSMLIALVSDLSHAQLPRSEDEAWSRFRVPPDARSWKLSKDQSGMSSDEDLTKHSRALSTQCIQEMKHALLDEIVDRLKAASLFSDVEFWTTQEARERCLLIVDKIGGPDEQRRASALLSDIPDSATENVSNFRESFWRGSRYSSSYFHSLLPIKIHSSSLQTAPVSHSSPFWGHLMQTCQHILSHDIKPHPKLNRKYGEMERAKVTKINTKLTVHTVESMLIGACLGITTLTANRASIKAILREMKGINGAGKGMSSHGLFSRREGVLEEDPVAAVWIVEPRSLAEGMRIDHL